MSSSCHALIELPERVDARGALVFAQQGDHIPFPVMRFFVIHDVTSGSIRGGHAHRAQHQFIVMLAGKCVVTVDNGTTRTPVALERPNLGLYAPPMLWLELSGFSEEAVCLVLTSGVYTETDYIRDRGEFMRLSGDAQ